MLEICPLATGEKEQTPDGVEKNFAVNVIAPLILIRALVPALKAAGRVQITSGGMPFDTLQVDDLESVHVSRWHPSVFPLQTSHGGHGHFVG